MRLLKKEFVFTGTPDVPSCHASTILRTADGTLVCAWFAGSYEKNPDVGIWYTVCQNGVWCQPRRIPSKEQVAHWNPALFEHPDGTVCLYYKYGETIYDWKTMTVTFDKSFTPGEPCEMVAGDCSGGRGPVKNKPILLSNGTVLAPGSTERGVWKSFVDRLPMNGEWEKVDIPSDESVNLIQPTLWESQNGCVHALMRSNDGHIYRSDSTDFGVTWCKAYPTPHSNNNSGIDCTYTADKTLILVCNPVQTNWGKRTPLSIFTSRDNGITFTEALRLETAPGEYSYPAVITHGDKLYVSYTYQRSFIAFCEIEM